MFQKVQFSKMIHFIINVSLIFLIYDSIYSFIVFNYYKISIIC